MPSDEENIQKIIQKTDEIPINDNVKELYMCFNKIIKEALEHINTQDLPQDLPQDLQKDLGTTAI